MKSCNKIKKICRAVAAWQLVFVLALQGPGFPGMPCPEAVLAADEPFLLDLDYILSYEQEQCSDMIFFGDSRVVGMSWSAGAYHYVGKGATGYYWMSSEGEQLLLQMMAEWPQADVVFCFGVNDLHNIDLYIDWFLGFQNRHPDTRCWYLSVNPVIDAMTLAVGYMVTNSQIEEFNRRLKETFPDRYLDSYDYLVEYGIITGDGVHYGDDTNAALEDLCWRAISEKLEAENEAKRKEMGLE